MAIVRGITATEIDVDDPIGLRGCKGSWIYSGPLVGDHYTQTDWGYACRRSLPWSLERYSIVKLPKLLKALAYLRIYICIYSIYCEV